MNTQTPTPQKTNQLVGAELDYAVSMCEKTGIGALKGDILYLRIKQGVRPTPYSQDWSHCGSIIEREKISITPENNSWVATLRTYGFNNSILNWSVGYGDTSLIAAMRCYVTHRLGNEVPIPEGLTR